MKNMLFILLFLLIISCAKNNTANSIDPGQLKKIYDKNIKESFYKADFKIDDILNELYDNYNKYNIINCDKKNNEDILIFQYNFFDWEGEKDIFKIEFVRQYVKDMFLFGETYIQLNIALFYEAKNFNNKFEPYSIYLDDNNTYQEWLNEIKNSEGWQNFKEIKPYKYEIFYDYAE